MSKEFTQLVWNEHVEEDCRRIVRLAVLEDLDRGQDWTTVALAHPEALAEADFVVRQPGVVAGLAAVPVILDEMEIEATWTAHVADGTEVGPGTRLATIGGHARDLLTSERLLLNTLGRLSGIATLTRQYVQAVTGTKARVYDTRKTTPGLRRLEKYAVHCGGGHNHRLGLYDAILIKDNHLALGKTANIGRHYTPAEAVRQARQFVQEYFAPTVAAAMIVEVEVDSLEQFEGVLSAGPDIILLDNMSPAQLHRAVALRDASGVAVELEASGGINLSTIRAVAETGVERISSGALTHSAIGLDIGLDWRI
jgi:nicotinate-nucleotide pyrophosphorylase (carboxylating)